MFCRILTEIRVQFDMQIVLFEEAFDLPPTPIQNDYDVPPSIF